MAKLGPVGVNDLIGGLAVVGQLNKQEWEVALRFRQSWIMAGKSLPYCWAREALDSPWYQMVPAMV